MKKILLVFLVFFVSVFTQIAMGGPGTFPKGARIKALMDQLEFKSGLVKIISGDSDDPQSVAKLGDEGSMFIQNGTGQWFRKTDTGSTTNWQHVVFGAPGLGTDECVARWDGTAVPLLQSSVFCITDLGVGTGLIQLDVANVRMSTSTISTIGVGGNLVLDPNFGGELVFNDLTGAGTLPALISATGVVRRGLVDLTSMVTGILPVANGGTATSTPLVDDRVAVTKAGAITYADFLRLTTGELVVVGTVNATSLKYDTVLTTPLTGSSVPIINVAGELANSGVSVNELQALIGVIAPIQPQIDGKLGIDGNVPNRVLITTSAGQATTDPNITYSPGQLNISGLLKSTSVLVGGNIDITANNIGNNSGDLIIFADDATGNGVFLESPAGINASPTLQISQNLILSATTIKTVAADMSINSGAFLNLNAVSGINASGSIMLVNNGAIKLQENSLNGSNFISIESATSISSDVRYIMPQGLPSSGDILSASNGVSPIQLDWIPSPSGGSGSSVGLRSGCALNMLSATSSPQVRVDPCNLEVNGSFVATSTSTDLTIPVSFRSATQSLYIYAQDGSSGTSLTLVASTSTPDNQQKRPGSDDRIVGRIFTTPHTGLDQYSADSYGVNSFVCRDTGWISEGATVVTAESTDPTKPTTIRDEFTWKRECDNIRINWNINFTANDGAVGSGTYFINMPPSVYFATGTDGSPVWYQGSMNSGQWDASANIGFAICFEASSLNPMYGYGVVYDSTRFRIALANPASSLEYAFGGAFTVCNFDTNDKNMSGNHVAKILNWSY